MGAFFVFLGEFDFAVDSHLHDHAGKASVDIACGGFKITVSRVAERLQGIAVRDVRVFCKDIPATSHGSQVNRDMVGFIPHPVEVHCADSFVSLPGVKFILAYCRFFMGDEGGGNALTVGVDRSPVVDSPGNGCIEDCPVEVLAGIAHVHGVSFFLAGAFVD